MGLDYVTRTKHFLISLVGGLRPSPALGCDGTPPGPMVQAALAELAFHEARAEEMCRELNDAKDMIHALQENNKHLQA